MAASLKYPLSLYRRALNVAVSLAVFVYLALVIRFAWAPTPLAQALAAIGIAAAFAHAAMAYAFKHAAALFFICVVITFMMENIGAATGFPFGRYHFEVGGDLPHIGAIPIIVGPLWFGMGYFAWSVAGSLLDGADYKLRKPRNLIALPIVAAFVMAQWDLVMDSPNATVAKAWIWHDGGAFFGVPLSNYLGWLLTSWLFYQAFAFYLRRQAALAEASRSLRALAILFYVSAGLTYLTPWLLNDGGEAADRAGHIWRVQDVHTASVITMIFGMGFTAILSAIRLMNLIQPEAN